MAHISSKATEFISALVKHLQAVCHGHFDFDENIKVVGHLFLTVDSCSEFNYVLNERVSKTDKSSTTFVSRSFYATDPQQKPLVKAELNENMIPLNQNQRQQWQNQQESQAQFSEQRQKQQIMRGDSQHTSFQNRSFQKRSSESASPVPVNKMPRIGEHGNQMQQNRQQQQQHIIYNRGSLQQKVDSRASPQMGNSSGEFQKKLPVAQAVGNKTTIKSEPIDPSHDLKNVPKTSPSLPGSTRSPAPKSHIAPFASQPNNIKGQVIDVDLTKVKEEPQDEQYSLAEQKAFAEAEAWSKGEGKYEDDYGEEGVYGEEGYDEEGYGEEEYGEGEYGEGYEDESNYEFMTGFREKGVDLYPVGYVNQQGEQVPVSNHPAIPTTSGNNQKFVQNPRNPTSQGAGTVLPFPIPPIAGGRKMMPKLPCKYCGKYFAGEATLSRHIKSQHLQIRVNCPICFVSFARKESMKKHMLKKHSNELAAVDEVACPICEEPFTNQDQLQQHLFQVHRLNPPAS